MNQKQLPPPFGKHHSLFAVKASLPEETDKLVHDQFRFMFFYGVFFLFLLWILGDMLFRHHPGFWGILLIAVFAMLAIKNLGNQFAVAVLYSAIILFLFGLPTYWGLALWALVLLLHAGQFIRHYVWLETAAPMPLEQAQTIRRKASGLCLFFSVLLAPLGLLWLIFFSSRANDAWRSWFAYSPAPVPGLMKSPAGCRTLRTALTNFSLGLTLLPVFVAFSSFYTGDLSQYFVIRVQVLDGALGIILMILFGLFVAPGGKVVLWSTGALAFYLPLLEKAKTHEGMSME